MPFASYKNMGMVLKKFQIIYREENYVVVTPVILSDYFQAELNLVRTELVTNNSEYAVCENLIYPLLKEIWKLHKEQLMLWSHEPLNYDEDLSGVPDYLIAQKSPLGKLVFEQPYLMVVEAKKDNFTEGWGQCLAELVAAQKLNGNNFDQTLFGIVSNGEIWEFGKLVGQQFTKNSDLYAIKELDKLGGVLNYLFEQCKLQFSC
ncbi:hypothetical protein THII_1079 [Thioploca ingrica]|uniref:Uncharacterized protein n=1 Tax=Thioploca ingrica TaxID=40754 RepID=A0A090BUM7_9GAMM|nr:hypothetical protein THII_1079 [Thioploca ingrica]